MLIITESDVERTGYVEENLTSLRDIYITRGSYTFYFIADEYFVINRLEGRMIKVSKNEAGYRESYNM